MGLEWVWGLLQPGFVRAPPPASQNHFNHWSFLFTAAAAELNCKLNYVMLHQSAVDVGGSLETVVLYSVVSEAICKWGGIMPARSAGRNFWDVPPHFSIVPPT